MAETFQEGVDRRRAERMRRVDAMPEPLRACVHDYGLTIVDAFLHAGVTKPRHIRHLVRTVLQEMSPLSNGGGSRQGSWGGQ